MFLYIRFHCNFKEVGGNDVRSLNLHWIRSQIGYVAQEPVLFNCSIKDNITYGLSDEDRATIEQSEIEAVAMSANIHHFISSLPNVRLLFRISFIYVCARIFIMFNT